MRARKIVKNFEKKNVLIFKGPTHDGMSIYYYRCTSTRSQKSIGAKGVIITIGIHIKMNIVLI